MRGLVDQGLSPGSPKIVDICRIYISLLNKCSSHSECFLVLTSNGIIAILETRKISYVRFSSKFKFGNIFYQSHLGCHNWNPRPIVLW